MSWRNFFIGIAVAAALIFVGVWAWKVIPQSYVEKQIERVKREVEERNDGSTLIYDDLVVKGTDTQLSRIIFQDGVTGARVALFDVNAKADRDQIDSFHASRVEWINPEGNLLSLDNLSIDDIKINPEPQSKWNQYLFSHLQAENLTLSGKVPSQANVDILAEQMVMNGMHDGELDEFLLQNLDIAYSPSIKAHLDDLRLENLDGNEIRSITAALDAGYIPVKPLSELAGNDLTMEGLQFDLGNGHQLEKFRSDLAEQDILQLFLNLAPEELTDFIGTEDAGTLKSMLEALGQQDPEDLARGALGLMLQYLDNQ